MTSTLILFFIYYCGIIALWRAFDDQLRAARIVAVVTLVKARSIFRSSSSLSTGGTRCTSRRAF